MDPATSTIIVPTPEHARAKAAREQVFRDAVVTRRAIGREFIAIKQRKEAAHG